MARFLRHTLFVLAILSTCTSAFAVNPDEVLKNPALEARARAISSELRCLVCQNQSIDISDADLAKDLRVIVRERLVAGDSDAAIIDYVVARYGEFVLLKPRFSAKNMVLWSSPFLLLLIGASVMLTKGRRSVARESAPALSEDERQRLAEIMHTNDQD
jgi:cytochrome c-type biogenesis protein CcmH